MYAVSKTALLGLTKALAEELGPDGIRVNCVAPGTSYFLFLSSSMSVFSIEREMNAFFLSFFEQHTNND